MLCAVLGTLLQERLGGFGEGTEEVYQNAAWIRGYKLKGEDINYEESLDKLELCSLMQVYKIYERHR